MKKGDLVKMKYEMWWKIRNLGNPGSSRKDYTDQVGIVYSTHAKGVKVILPDGKIKVGLIDHWEVISESDSD